MKSDLSYFENRDSKLSSDIHAASGKSVMLSVLRFFAFALTVAALLVAMLQKMTVLYYCAIALFVAFIILCIVHEKVHKKLNYLEALQIVNSQYIARIKGDFDSLVSIATADYKRRDEIEEAIARFGGNEFFNPDHDYCLDLDLFGRKSIYALYNVSETAFGRAAFADELLGYKASRRSVSEITERQKAVEELGNRPEFMENYQAVARLGKLHNSPKALSQFAADGKLMGKLPFAIMWFCLLLWLVPIAVLFVAPTMIKVACLSVMIANLVLWGIGLVINKQYLDSGYGMPMQVKTIWRLFSELESAKFNSSLLVKLSSGATGDVKAKTPASDSLLELSVALFFASLRNQPIFALIINVFVPLDYFVSYLMGRWAAKHGSSFKNQLDALAQVEALMCAAQVMVSSDNSAFPTFIDSDAPEDNSFFKGDDIVHPLLKHESAVSNSIEIKSNIALITGSNMSGKTTLIRTVGVCCILAYSGAPIMCTDAKLGRMRIISSMRIVDSLEDNISTFRAELIRISRIIEGSKTGESVLFLIDEIFRGTNSDDRTEGALTVLHNLSMPNICGMMTTHDYAMIDKTCDTFNNVVYYHFSENYTDSGIAFDYMLKAGISRESNAKYLMKLVGIL